jgi:preprotein translocase subunit YajC
MRNEGNQNPSVKSSTSQQELDEITSKLDQLQIEFDRKKTELLIKREQIIERSNKDRILRNKNKSTKDLVQSNSPINPYKVGQRVRINNKYSGDHGVSSKGVIGTIIKVNKVQVNIKDTESGKYYTRSYKNISLVDQS